MFAWIHPFESYSDISLKDTDRRGLQGSCTCVIVILFSCSKSALMAMSSSGNDASLSLMLPGFALWNAIVCKPCHIKRVSEPSSVQYCLCAHNGLQEVFAGIFAC